VRKLGGFTYMANIKIALLRYAEVPDLGWRRGAAVIGKTGKVKPDYMLLNGVEVYAPKGRYELRQYIGNKAIYTNVGTEPQEALFARDRAAEELRQRNNGYIPINGTSTKPNAKPESLEDFRKKYLTRKSKGSRYATHHHNVTVNGFLATVTHTLPSQVEQDDVVNYCELLDKTLSPRTRSNRYLTLRSFLKSCGLKPEEIIEDYKHREMSFSKDREIAYYEDAEMQQLLSVCTPYYRLLFKFLWLTGLREKEAMYLTWDDIRKVKGTDRHEISVQEKIFKNNAAVQLTFTLKTTSSDREVPLVADLYAELMAWKAQRPGTVLIFGTENDAPNGHMLEFLKKFVSRAGLNCGTCKKCKSGKKTKSTNTVACKRWYLHGFRSTFASNLFYVTSNIKKVQRILGHSEKDLSSTLRYLRSANKEELRDAVDEAMAKRAASVDKPFMMVKAVTSTASATA
jgi:integrase